MKLLAIFTVCLATFAYAQVPGITGCPDYRAMEDFDIERFIGKWYESQRYFQVLEVGTRCVATEYRKSPDGKIIVANEMVPRLTGIKRVIEGEVKSVGKSGEAKLSVRYSNFPFNFDSTYSILDTDYDNYAIAWSCNSLGPFSSTHAWLMTRKRSPTEAVIQRAYGVLDKFGISRTFFVSSDQSRCDLDDAEPAATPAKKPVDNFTAAANEAVASIPTPVVAATSNDTPTPTKSAIATPTVPVPLPLVTKAAADAAASTAVEEVEPEKTSDNLTQN